MVHIALQKKVRRDDEKEKPTFFLKFVRQSQSVKPEPMPKKLRSSQLWHDRVELPLADEMSKN